MAAENFLTYPETDPNSRITVISSRVTCAGIARNEDAYVYSDKGANYFDGNFVHLLTVCFTAVSATDGRVYLWGLTNTVDDMKGIDDGGGSYFGLFFYKGSTTYQLYLEQCDSGSISQDNYTGITLNTVYYLKIVRDEAVGTYGTLYCYIYSDSARTTLVDTLAQTLLTSKKDFRYLFAANSWNSGNTQTASAYCEDLTIEGGSASILPVVTQAGPRDITATTMTGNGFITSLGLSAVTAHGHCWNTTGDPTTSDSKVDNGAKSTTGAFTSAITGLTPGTRYYFRAYATNSYGTAYSEGISLIVGDSTSVLIFGNIAVVQNQLHYVGADGKQRFIEGTIAS